MMKVAIYARVSTEKQEQQETVNSQLEALREYVKGNGLDLHKEYVDDGYSGELLDRPALDELRDDAKRKLFDEVIVHSPDRLSRKYIYLGLLQEELKRLNVSLIFLNRPDSKDTPEENLLNGVQGLIAEYEKAKILERTRRGRLHKARGGILVGGMAPYGYRYVKGEKFGRYEVVSEEARVVRLIFDLFVNKQLSIRAVARELTRKGIPPQRGKLWRTSSLHRIIRNETYAGVTYFNKHVSCEAKHPRAGRYRRAKNSSRRLRPRDLWIAISLPQDLVIISRETFDRAQRQLILNAEHSPRNVKYQYLLRGLVRCGFCDSPMYGTPSRGKLYYRCGNRHRAFPLPKNCEVKMVSGPELERVVWEKFCQAIQNPRLIISQLPKLRNRIRPSFLTQDLEEVKKQRARAEEEEGRLLDAYRENIITLDQLKDQMGRLQEKKKALQDEEQRLGAQLQSLSRMVSPEKSIREYCAQISRRLKSIGNDFESRRYLLSLALNQVLVENKTVRIRGIVPTPPQDVFSECCIASPSSGCCARRQRRSPWPVWPRIGL
jgi:site-specific DNA recombinase